MKYDFTVRFRRSYTSFPRSIQKKFDKQLAYLLIDTYILLDITKHP